MSKPVFRITATIEFILHSDYEDETEGVVVEAIRDALEDQRIGVSEYGSAAVTSINIQPIEC